MLEKKQIEEMSEEIASMLCEAYGPNCDEYQPHTCSYCYVNSTPIGCFAEMLYNAGYRKQSENTIEFPCKVGDKAWLVFTPRSPANPSDKGKWFMVEDGVQRLIYGAKGVSIETWNMGTISAREIGKKLFFTKEEAEKALAENKK